MEAGESYTELSVERLAHEADISRSTFYTYFEDKGDLLRQFTGDIFDDLMASAAAWWSLPPELTKADLRGALGGLFDAYWANRLMMGAVVEAAMYDAVVRDGFMDAIERGRSAFAEHIRSAQAEGWVDPALDAEPTAAWLTWMGERGLNQLGRTATAAQSERHINALADVYWHTLYAYGH